VGGWSGTDRSWRRKISEEHGEQREGKILLLSGVQAAAAAGGAEGAGAAAAGAAVATESGLWRAGWVENCFFFSRVGH
jgi:hypothetical protein